MADLTRGERNCAWIQTHCLIPDGEFVGRPVVLREFQRDIIKGIYDNEHGTRRAIVSVGRKNAKTALSAFLLLIHLCGPEAKPNSELYSTALSREQAAIIFRLASKVVRLSETLRHYVTPRDTVKQLFCEDLGTLYQALSADASTAMGLSPVFTVHDELGQVRGPRHSLYEALETATAAQESPMSIIISTQAPTDADLLSILIDDALQEHDPRTKLFLWTADTDGDPFDDKTIRQANPAFDDFQNAQEVRDMAEAARRMPSREAEYRNLILNQRVEAYNPFVTKTVWDANAAQPKEGQRAYAGLDLSETNDLTALVLAFPDCGKLSIKPTFWLPEDGIQQRAHDDRVPYDVWADEGYITLTPGRSVEYEYVAVFVAGLFEEYDIVTIAFDRWNMKHLRPWLVKAGINERVIDNKFQNFGQGYQSMSPALRNLESLLLNGKIRHGGHPVMNMCAANAVVKMDEAGSRKLNKRRSRGRIDGMVALTMAAAAASEDAHERHALPVERSRIVESLGA